MNDAGSAESADDMLGSELEGTLVISLEQAVAAPYCGLLLADAGARVIKVERPEGDFARGYDRGANGQSAIFAWLNRGKQSIALDLKSPEDMALLRNALGSADVLLSNLAPGSIGRYGLDGPALREANPGLITCAISGYGETGDAAKKKAYDFLVQAESGISAVTGTQEAPARVGVSITDLGTGLTAFRAILRALLLRQRTDRGVDLSISMFDAMADWMNMPLLLHRYGPGAPARSGMEHSFVAPYGAFRTADGAVLLSIQNNREWCQFCEDVLQQPQLATDPRFADNADRFANRGVMTEIIETAFATRSRAQVAEMLDATRIANASLNSVEDVSQHPFLHEQVARFAGNDLHMAALPVATHHKGLQDVPALDQHGEAIRREFSGVAET
ncbi:MAG: CaiB/BaiF CoA-transferase family protein [Ahrensia sp.]|nr:CaiB/BaiF CoA-transferase family protein [Ahrensia sp.]